MNTAVEVMTALTSHDAQVVVEGDRVRLLFSADHPPPEALIEAARSHKQALRAILESRRESRPSGPYGHLLAALQSKSPDLVEPDHWRQAVKDANNFLTAWGEQAEALGWTAKELFGLHPVPEHPKANYRRLSRYDETGLIWLLRGRSIIALTETTAAIQGATGVLVYRRLNKPALGPIGDSLDDWGPILLADGVVRSRPIESTHRHGVPGTTGDLAGPTKDASTAICGATRPMQRMAEYLGVVKPSEDRRCNASSMAATAWWVADAVPVLDFVERLNTGEAVA